MTGAALSPILCRSLAAPPPPLPLFVSPAYLPACLPAYLLARLWFFGTHYILSPPPLINVSIPQLLLSMCEVVQGEEEDASPIREPALVDTIPDWGKVMTAMNRRVPPSPWFRNGGLLPLEDNFPHSGTGLKMVPV